MRWPAPIAGLRRLERRPSRPMERGGSVKATDTSIALPIVAVAKRPARRWLPVQAAQRSSRQCKGRCRSCRVSGRSAILALGRALDHVEPLPQLIQRLAALLERRQAVVGALRLATHRMVEAGPDHVGP